jgi:uncharacterized protein YjiS (DUF1127 family)
MEMIMSTVLDTDIRHESVAAGVGGAAMAAIKRSLARYLAWRAQASAIAHLKSMSERELRDIGLTRAEIPFVVRQGRRRDRILKMF